MNRGAFADLVTNALSTDVSIMDSVVAMSWDGKGEALLVRVEPVNQEAWKDIGSMIVEALRELATKVRVKAAYQLLNSNGKRNIVFSIKPQPNS